MTHDKFEGERRLMRIHIGESDKWHGKPLYEAIVEMLSKDGFSGVTVLRRGGRLRRVEYLSHRQNSSPVAGLADHPGNHRICRKHREDFARRDGRRRIDHARESTRDPVSRSEEIASQTSTNAFFRKLPYSGGQYFPARRIRAIHWACGDPERASSSASLCTSYSTRRMEGSSSSIRR